MPVMGDKVLATAVGLNHLGKVRWARCPQCGKERWVTYRGEKHWGIVGKKFCLQCTAKNRDYKRENHPNWKGGRKKCGSDYIGILMPEHPRAHKSGYVYEHIQNWEQAHGQPLPKGWVVHHLNGIKNDNRPQNLLAISRKGHSPALAVKEVQGRLREVEAKLAQQTMEI